MSFLRTFFNRLLPLYEAEAVKVLACPYVKIGQYNNDYEIATYNKIIVSALSTKSSISKNVKQVNTPREI